MRIEIILLLLSGGIIYNIYTEGKFLKLLLSYKKYYQMAGILLGAFFLYYIIKKNPLQAKQVIMNSNEYLKYLPIDKNTSDMISPILNFTSTQNWMNGGDGGGGGGNGNYNQPQYPIIDMGGSPNSGNYAAADGGGHQQQVKATKRSVSESKKKFVASRQNWHCDSCKNQLNHTFEIDHKIRLEYGGSNHVDNLTALCRNCHGEKTAMENINNSSI